MTCYSVVEGDGSITLATDWYAVTENDVSVAGAAGLVSNKVLPLGLLAVGAAS